MARTSLLFVMLLLACDGPKPAQPQPEVVGAGMTLDRPTPTRDSTLPTFGTRDPKAPSAGSWLPSAWYCRLPKQPDPLAQAEADATWERRAMDIYSWDAFIAIQWPQRWDGEAWQPADDVSTAGDGWVPRWGTWFNDVDVTSLSVGGTYFRTSADGWQCQGECFQTALAGENYEPDDNGLWDRAGRRVRFETRLNDVVISALDPSIARLSFQTGQCATEYPRKVCKGTDCEPCGSPPLRSCIPSSAGETVIGDTFDKDAAVLVKLAWRVLDPNEDDLTRFVVMRGVQVDGEPHDLGLIAMHVLQKPKTHPRWTWSSFEHIDNLQGRAGQPAAFLAGTCPNTVPPRAPVRHTHLTRTAPIDPSTADLNREVQAMLAAQHSPLANYELVGTQYSRYGHTRTPPRPVKDSLPDCSHEADVAESVVTPAQLRNAIIEPYLVPGTTECPNPVRPRTSTCMGCHAAAPTCDFSFVDERLRPAAGGTSGESGASEP